MEYCLCLGTLALIIGLVLGVVFAASEGEVVHLFIGAGVGAGFFVIFTFFGLLIGPIAEDCSTIPETRIEIVSSEGAVTFSDEGDIKIQEITDDFVKYSEDGEATIIYIEDSSKVKVIDLEDLR